MQALGCASEVEFFCYGNKATQMAQFHIHFHERIFERNTKSASLHLCLPASNADAALPVLHTLAKAVNVNRGKSRRCRNSYDEGHSSHLAAALELDP